MLALINSFIQKGFSWSTAFSNIKGESLEMYVKKFYFYKNYYTIFYSILYILMLNLIIITLYIKSYVSMIRFDVILFDSGKILSIWFEFGQRNKKIRFNSIWHEKNLDSRTFRFCIAKENRIIRSIYYIGDAVLLGCIL